MQIECEYKFNKGDCVKFKQNPEMGSFKIKEVYFFPKMDNTVKVLYKVIKPINGTITTMGCQYFTVTCDESLIEISNECKEEDFKLDINFDFMF